MLEVSNLNKNFYSRKGELEVLKDLNLKVEKGQIISLIGPSGCGKSTILNIISGLEDPSSGVINTNGKIGYMFQKDHLFPWLTIEDNILIGIKINKKVDNEDRKKAHLLLEKYDLIDFKHHHPHQLSGGMRQRVSLIRTLMTDPEILLLDEPFSALDAQTKINVIEDVYKIIKEEKKTTILVTHDISEAISFSDKIYLLTKRPSYIFKELEIKLNYDFDSPLSKRTAPEFKDYFNEIWSDLDEKK